MLNLPRTPPPHFPKNINLRLPSGNKFWFPQKKTQGIIFGNVSQLHCLADQNEVQGNQKARGRSSLLPHTKDWREPGTNVGSSLPLPLLSFLHISLRTRGFQSADRTFSALTTRIRGSRNKISSFTLLLGIQVLTALKGFYP